MAGVQSFSSLCNNMYDEADNEGEEEKDVDDQEVHIRMAPQSELLDTIKKTIAATLRNHYQCHWTLGQTLKYKLSCNGQCGTIIIIIAAL